MNDDRRKEMRIPVDKLPDCLKVITFKLGLLEEYSATTINASNFGMSFVCDGIDKTDVDTGQDLTVKISPQNYKLKSTVVYAQKVADKKLKFGISFHNGYPIEKYQELITDKL